MSRRSFDPRIFATGLWGLAIVLTGWTAAAALSYATPAASRPLLYAVSFIPWALAILRRDPATLAALAAAAALFLLPHMRDLEADHFIAAAIGIAALEARKPLGLLAYAAAVSSALVPHGYTGAVFAAAFAAVSTLVETRWGWGALFAAVTALGIIWPKLHWGLQWQYIAAGVAGAAVLRDRRLAPLPLSVAALGAASYFLNTGGVVYLSYPPIYSENYAVPLWLAWLAKAAFAATLLWDGRRRGPAFLGAVFAAAGVASLPTPAGDAYYAARPDLAHMFFMAAAAAYLYKGPIYMTRGSAHPQPPSSTEARAAF
jgi:hypothetical protein